MANSELSPYEQWQMEKYGYILDVPVSLLQELGPAEPRELSTAEEAFIFNNENPE